MSTRANIIIKDDYDKLIFYRHSDGYPEGVAPTLNEFIQLVRDGKIRNNVSQAAGWLIALGQEEYETSLKNISSADSNSLSNWKVGAYEPTTEIHGDIQYLYEIDLKHKTLEGWHYKGSIFGGVGKKGASVTAELEAIV